MNFDSKIVTNNNMIVTIDGQVYNVDKNHLNYRHLQQAYINNDADAFVKHFDVKDAVQKYVNVDGIKIEGDQVYHNGQPMHHSVCDTILNMMRDGFDTGPMVKFLENMLKNPNYNVVKSDGGLWNFIEKMGLTITEDGCFLAYKTVRSDMMDKYSGTIDNTPGAVIPRMDRNKVSDSENVCVGPGYHVGSLGYAGPDGWYNKTGDKIIICKVNPQDVVRVPTDHGFQKLVCCYYEPVSEFKGELKASVYSGKVNDNYTSEPPVQTFQSECVDDPYDLLVDNFYIASYNKENGDCGVRYFLVEEAHPKTSCYTVCLIEPEEHAGEYRTFKMDRLDKVCTWDGETDPAAIQDPWQVREMEEYEEEYCDICGEYDCDGYCDEDENEDENVNTTPYPYW